MKTSGKLLSFLLVFTIMIGCSQNSSVNENTNEKIPLDLPEMRAVDSKGETISATPATSWTGSVIYGFNDLADNCFFDTVFPNNYQDLTFPGTAYLAPCEITGFGIPNMDGIALIPAESSAYSTGSLTEIRIELTEPATMVRIYSANYAADIVNNAFYSNLVSYDVNGDQIDFDRNATNNGFGSSVLLTVGENDNIPIYSIGLGSFQAATFYDNLEILYGPVDTTPPEISFTQDETSLWPANHKMVLAVSGISVTDDYDENPSVSVTVASSELQNEKGSGNTDNDWEIVENSDGSLDVYLRAERSGKKSGRTYTVTISAEDETGNASEEVVEVTVAHDKGKGV